MNKRKFKVIAESEVYNSTKDRNENLKLNDEYIILREDVHLVDHGGWKCENIATKDIVLIPYWHCYNSIQEISPAEEILKKAMTTFDHYIDIDDNEVYFKSIGKYTDEQVKYLQQLLGEEE